MNSNVQQARRMNAVADWCDDKGHALHFNPDNFYIRPTIEISADDTIAIIQVAMEHMLQEVSMSYYRNFPIDFKGDGWYRLVKSYGLFKLIRCKWCEEAFRVLSQEVIYA